MGTYLTHKQIEHMDQPGVYAVGNPKGLYVRIREGKRGYLKQWIFRYMLNGKARTHGLGSLPTVSLAQARREAEAVRAKVRILRLDPVGERHTARQAAQTTQRRSQRQPSFKQVADSYLKTHTTTWTAKHAQQWANTLRTYAYPTLGPMPIDLITTADVMAVLQPIWTTKNETAMRLQTRIETILDAAKAQGLRSGDNPATMKGNLRELLPKISRRKRIKHHPALAYAELPAFFQRLLAEAGDAPRALAFTILTAARTGEVIGATWDEIDLDNRRWTVPKERMKAKVEHVVPLSRQALKLLAQLPADTDAVFCNPSEKALSNGAMAAVLKRMGQDSITVHGFRSTFRDWAGETTTHDRTVIEHALAHQLPDQSEAAYARGSQLKKRQALMQDWADFCWPPAARRKKARAKPTAKKVKP